MSMYYISLAIPQLIDNIVYSSWTLKSHRISYPLSDYYYPQMNNGRRRGIRASYRRVRSMEME